MSKRVFVSYAHRDRSLVDKLLAELGSLGVDVWSDRQIKAGENWSDALHREMQNADTFLYVLSPSSLSSDYSRHELETALKEGKQVVPVLVGEIDPSQVPEPIQHLQWLDLRHGDTHVIKRLSEYLSEGESAPPVDVKPQNKGYVFLSYAEEDRDFVEKLREFLKEQGYAYWDYEESDRDYHNQLFLELEEVILGATALFSILSESWKKSKWTVREYFFAEDAQIPVFLLRAKSIGPTLAVAGIPYIDFVSNEKNGFEKLNNELRRKGL